MNFAHHIQTKTLTGVSLCSVDSRELRFARAMVFAIDEINNSSELLPDIRLGYQIQDSCASVPMTMRAAFQLSNGLDPVFLTGDHCSKYFEFLVNYIYKRNMQTLIECALKYDGFWTIPSDQFQADALAKLVKHFGWTWIGAVRSDSDYGNNGMASFLDAAHRAGIFFVLVIIPVYTTTFFCFCFSRSTAVVVVAFAASGDMKILFNELSKKPSPPRQWIGTESWVTNPDMLRFSFCVGAVGFSIQQSVIPGLRDFLLDLSPTKVAASPVLTEFWEDVSTAKYLTLLLLFVINGYDVSFDANGDPVARYELVNWQISKSGSTEFVTVGHYDASLPAGQEFHINRNLTWVEGSTQVPVSVCTDSCPAGTRKVLQKGKPICCYDCVACPEGEISNTTDSLDCFPCPKEFWPNAERNTCVPKPVEFLSFDEILGIILAAFSVSGAFLAVITAAVFFRHRTSPIVKANNSELSFLLLLSLTLCFLCSLTFIGRPSEWSCMLRHTAFGITFVLCISCVLGKTIVVLMAFRATLPGSNVMKWFGTTQQRMTVVFFTFIQVLICTIWLVLSPPFPVKNLTTYKEKIILECALGSAVGFWAVLGYIGLLAVFCFVLAVLARKLPDNFNEAKFITFSMLIFCAVWLTFIPAYVSSPGKFTVAVEIFAILASSFGLIFCIFAPKCFIILLKPEKNTKKHLMNKN
uniref:G-protein coupled receptors family 3 profile domain-containing protein n=1 Tax=Echeneis naucrates TaxID=173247 RepID=A0A665USI6_ECHNA